MGDDVEELLHYNLIIKLFKHTPRPFISSSSTSIRKAKEQKMGMVVYGQIDGRGEEGNSY